MEEAEILLDNLLEFCSFYVNKDYNKDKSSEDLLGAAELEWSGRLQDIFHNTSMPKNTQDMPPLLKDVMAKFNSQHDFKVNSLNIKNSLKMKVLKYCFGNSNLVRVFKHYMKHQVSQSQAAKYLTEGTSITVQEMADKMGSRLHEMVVNEKEKKQRDKDQRSLEAEKEGIRRQLERRLVEEESPGKSNLLIITYFEQLF